MLEHRPLGKGDVIHGFGAGAFGRDHWGCVRITETGPDWIRARDENGSTASAEGVRSLVILMRERDEARCPVREEGGTCPMDQFVQLTDSGELVRVDDSELWGLGIMEKRT